MRFYCENILDVLEMKRRSLKTKLTSFLQLAEGPRLQAIMKLNEETKKNDYEINYLMRKKFRAEKKIIKVNN